MVSNTATVELITDRLEKPLRHEREGRVIRLPNELEVLLAHDPDTDNASASLNVHVGSFSDEEDMPGMAHAVEHLLSKGNKKFPAENGFFEYLGVNNGYSNAHTMPTSTKYVFQVAAKPKNNEEPSSTNPSPLKEALHRFAENFISPLFSKDTIDRELQAVHSEHQKNTQLDSWRLEQVEKSLSNHKHPYHRFATGNLDVLQTQPEAKGIDIRDRLVAFWKRHYSANVMKLVVLGREPLNVLENWVAEMFSGIQNKSLVPNRWKEEFPYRESELGVQVFAKPIMNLRELRLRFPFPEHRQTCTSQPDRYISHLIGHKGPGSITAYLKEKGWSNELRAYAESVCDGTPDIFHCDIRLTEEGIKNYKHVVLVFFRYVSLLRESPPPEWIFDEIKSMADVNFKYPEKTDEATFACTISALMQEPMPREWLLSGHSLLRTFDGDLIERCVACLRPDNFRMTIVSQELPEGYNQEESWKQERWYGVEYFWEKIPDDFMKDIKEAASCMDPEQTSKLHFPHRNSLIPVIIDLDKEKRSGSSTPPRLIRNESTMRVWWKESDFFNEPKATFTIKCWHPDIYSTPQDAVTSGLFVNLMMDHLYTEYFHATLAGLRFGIDRSSHGLLLTISGYEAKLDSLLKHVLDAVSRLEFSETRFDMIKEDLTLEYQNDELDKPYKQVWYLTGCLNSEPWHAVETLRENVASVTIDDVRHFRKKLLAPMHLEIYAHGDLQICEAHRLADLVAATLRPPKTLETQRPVSQSLIIPKGSEFLYEKTLKDPDNVNHCIEMFLYVGDNSDRSKRAKAMLFHQMVRGPVLDQLRTKEQLGYVVDSDFRSFFSTCGISFKIQSQQRPAYLESRIEEFLRFFCDVLHGMSEADFDKHKRSLILRCLQKPRNLIQESKWTWGQIESKYYDFEGRCKDAECIKTFTLDDIVEFCRQYMKPGSLTRGKLSVHLLARADGSEKTKLDMSTTSNSTRFTDIDCFKKDLSAMPLTPMNPPEAFME
ncbi:peptidase M16 inactive domain-containing protein [Colletotrichum tamarilloi]|nr:peptidase M16 inactive domain-containing protein [Colletotrichum tamarilloi]KAK1470436.1 peptidase M16 inactive domain-containing protein [Colletotrichum tamarilloi]